MSGTTLFDETTVSNKPVKSFKIRGISAAIFANPAKDCSEPFHKVSLQRTFKVGDKFKTNSSFSRDDLPMAQFVLGQALNWILTEETKQKTTKA